MARVRWLWLLVLLSITIVGLDIITGPHILFPILFVIPVGLAAWYVSRTAGIAFALAQIGSRLWISVSVEAVDPVWAAYLNAGIRLLVLVGLAVLLDKIAQQQRALAKRVQVLEGILPICAFCKKIRRPDGTWEQIEAYISQRSTAQFSHGFCEACGREHYGEFFNEPSSQVAEPG